MRAAVVRLLLPWMALALAACPSSPGFAPLLEEPSQTGEQEPAPEDPGDLPPPAKPAPAPPDATPGNGYAVVSWPPVTGATSFNVYYSELPTITKGDPKVQASGSPAMVFGLTNGSVTYFAVSAVTADGEGPLSGVACAMPTAADTTGLTLYDALCGPTLDGRRWGRPGASSAGVAGGGAVLGVDVANQSPRAEQGAHYWASADVLRPAGTTVTAVRADLRVAPGAASVSDGVLAKAAVRLTYRPPLMQTDGLISGSLMLEAGLLQTSAGLRVYRMVYFCATTRDCTVWSAEGIAFADPPALSPVDETTSGAPAAYDTTYTVGVCARGALRAPALDNRGRCFRGRDLRLRRPVRLPLVFGPLERGGARRGLLERLPAGGDLRHLHRWRWMGPDSRRGSTTSTSGSTAARRSPSTTSAAPARTAARSTSPRSGGSTQGRGARCRPPGASAFTSAPRARARGGPPFTSSICSIRPRSRSCRPT